MNADMKNKKARASNAISAAEAIVQMTKPIPKEGPVDDADAQALARVAGAVARQTQALKNFQRRIKDKQGSS